MSEPSPDGTEHGVVPLTGGAHRSLTATRVRGSFPRRSRADRRGDQSLRSYLIGCGAADAPPGPAGAVDRPARHVVAMAGAMATTPLTRCRGNGGSCSALIVPRPEGGRTTPEVPT